MSQGSGLHRLLLSSPVMEFLQFPVPTASTMTSSGKPSLASLMDQTSLSRGHQSTGHPLPSTYHHCHVLPPATIGRLFVSPAGQGRAVCCSLHCPQSRLISCGSFKIGSFEFLSLLRRTHLSDSVTNGPSEVEVSTWLPPSWVARSERRHRHFGGTLKHMWGAPCGEKLRPPPTAGTTHQHGCEPLWEQSLYSRPAFR